MSVINDWACPGNLTILGAVKFVGGITGDITPLLPNLPIGSNALSVVTGISNVGIGANAMPILTTGNSNVTVGYNSATSMLTANNNIAIGNNSLQNNISGNRNIGIGNFSAVGTSNVNIGNNNVITGNNNVVIGNNNVVTANNAIVICKQGATVNNNGFYLDSLTDHPLGNYMYYDPTTKEVTYFSPAFLSVSQLVATRPANQLVMGEGLEELTINSPDTGNIRTYTIPDVGASANFVMTDGTQNIGGIKTFQNTINTKTITIGNGVISAPNNIGNTYTVPDIGTGINDEFIMDSGGQTINSKTFTNVNGFKTANLDFINTNIVSIVADTSTKTLTIPNISASANFVMISGAQNIGGIKTFSGFSAGSLLFGNLSVSTTGTGTYTFPDLANGDFLMTAGNQTVTGIKTFTNNLSVSSLTFSSGPTTITSTQTSNCIITIPDVTSGDFIMSTDTQTINGIKTFNNIQATTINLYNAVNSQLVSATQTSNNTLTIPSSGNADFVLTNSTANIAGNANFTTPPIISGSLNMGQITIQSTQTVPRTFGINTGGDFLMTSGNQFIYSYLSDQYKSFANSIRITGNNTFYGISAGSNNTTGSNNTAVGYSALFNNTTGNYNVAIGYEAITGNANSNSICIGGNSVSLNASRAIVLSAHATPIATPANEGFYVKPIAAKTTTANVLNYNTTSSEITYLTTPAATIQKGTIFAVTYSGPYNITINYNPSFATPPIIAYSPQYDYINGTMQYYINSNTTTSANIYVNPSNPSGLYNTSASSNMTFIGNIGCCILNNGNVAFAFYNSQVSSGVGLYYRTSTNVTGSTWTGGYNYLINSTSATDVDMIKLSNNRLGIVTAGTLYFYYSNNDNPTIAADWTRVSLPDATANFVSIAISPFNNFPCIAYCLSNGNVKFSMAGDITGTTGWTNNTAYSTSSFGAAGVCVKLLFSGNNPEIGFIIPSTSKFFIQPSTNASGTNWSGYTTGAASNNSYITGTRLTNGNTLYFYWGTGNQLTVINGLSSLVFITGYTFTGFPQMQANLINGNPIVIFNGLYVMYATKPNPTTFADWYAIQSVYTKTSQSYPNIISLSTGDPISPIASNNTANSVIQAFTGISIGVNYIAIQ